MGVNGLWESGGKVSRGKCWGGGGGEESPNTSCYIYIIFIYHLLTGLPTRLKVPLQMQGPGNNIQSILKQCTAALHIN